MNVPFQSLSLETQIQVVIVYIDMALAAVGQFLSIAVPLIVMSIIVFMLPSPNKRRGGRR